MDGVDKYLGQVERVGDTDQQPNNTTYTVRHPSTAPYHGVHHSLPTLLTNRYQLLNNLLNMGERQHPGPLKTYSPFLQYSKAIFRKIKHRLAFSSILQCTGNINKNSYPLHCADGFSVYICSKTN